MNNISNKTEGGYVGFLPEGVTKFSALGSLREFEFRVQLSWACPIDKKLKKYHNLTVVMKMAGQYGILLLQMLLCGVFVALRGSELQSAEYGVDVSFPIHRYIKDKKSIFNERYERSMSGCYKSSSKSECDATERARMEQNREQPRSQHNYTEIGFKKTRVPDDLWREILEFYEDHKTNENLEEWPPGNTYVNNWESPTFMISFEDRVTCTTSCSDRCVATSSE